MVQELKIKEKENLNLRLYCLPLKYICARNIISQIIGTIRNNKNMQQRGI